MTLPNDVSRCCGYECARREQCARYQALYVPSEWLVSVHAAICDDKTDAFIPAGAK